VYEAFKNVGFGVGTVFVFLVRFCAVLQM